MSADPEKLEDGPSSDCGRILQTQAISMIDQITVNVGTSEDNKKFPVLEAVIRKSSRFFDNALKHKWAANKTEPRTIDLSEDSPDIFNIYLHWLYFQQMPIARARASGNKQAKGDEYIDIAKCYVLGEKLMDNAFKNAILTALVDAYVDQPAEPRLCPGRLTLQVIYAGTMEGSPARRLLVDIWVRLAKETWIQHLTEDLPHAFVLEFSRALLLSKCSGKDKDDEYSWKEFVKDYMEEER
ncbi:hypothetical protein BU25DRAFT_419701 [Macroventuria anomochaeta]|uniref:Uncharacterized protein n=1 Tax=Macroventuria anomochaeta TaxID=301207 RepID=A0ACB6S783_9PLEO|nr:uncharacterized protein BU25DRAFT_419701 [Macroventuria anomochaeta]KAF2630061.1 hypothetical protein BU25DRAFT_419701 [Macroventuria anomochaeta]